jgi:phosphoglycerate dehydrogenase-like enzyme
VTATLAGECRRLAVKVTQPIERLVFGWDIPQNGLDALRAKFPDVDITKATGDEFIAALPTADAAVAWSMTPEEFAAASKLRWFQSIGAGVERVILPGMRERGLIVTNSSGIHGASISEHLLAMMFAFARQLPVLIRASEHGQWRDDIRSSIFELGGQTLHIVGYGDIGRTLGRKAKALGMHVTATRRHPDSSGDENADSITGFDDLPGRLANADHVAITLPQTPDTIHFFDADLLGKIRPGAYLYNIGRGPIVETQALIQALDSGHLAGAGLDVTDPEPLPADSPLWGRENVIITSHTAGSTPHFQERLMGIVSENLRRIQAGEPPLSPVDLSAGY